MKKIYSYDTIQKSVSFETLALYHTQQYENVKCTERMRNRHTIFPILELETKVLKHLKKDFIKRGIYSKILLKYLSLSFVMICLFKIKN